MPTRLHLSLLTLILLLLTLAACGGAAAPSETATPAPTNTAIIPTFSFTQPTAPPSVATAAATVTVGVAAVDTQAIERGRGRYEALDCASCHGDVGEGIDGEKSLLAYAATEAEFISFMRSGGELGTDHQYSTNRLSESGGRNLYLYLMSLQGGS